MKTHRLQILAAFVLHASTAGGIYARLPEIQSALAISEGVYGLVLFGLPVGVLSGSLTVPRHIERLGAPKVIVFGLVAATLLQMLAALAPGPVALFLVLIVYGFVFACANVSINVEANRFEAANDARIISLCHGWWALGFLATSFAAAGLIGLGVAPFWQFTGHAALMIIASALLIAPMPHIKSTEDAPKARRFALPGKGVTVIGLWALAGILMEGTTRGWIVIYARDTFAAGEALAALALPAVVMTQTLGRFAGDGLISRFGIVAVARASSLALGLGIFTIVIASSVSMLLLGCMIIGFGIAINMPQGFAAAARLKDRPSAESVAGFASVSTLIGFMGPSLFGLVTEAIGLRTAFALVIPATILSFLLARVLAQEESTKN